MNPNRRHFLQQLGLATAGIGVASMLPETLFATNPAKKFTFEISLAEFSFAGELYTGKMKNMDFPAKAKNDFGISVVEYVSGFFNNKYTDQTYLNELKKRCDDLGVKNHLIMVDGENIADLDAAKRQKAVESHYAWVDAAKFLGCLSIRVNLGDAKAAMTGEINEGPADEVAKAAVDGYGKLLEYAGKAGLNVIVENHFGLSTDPDWLVGVMKQEKAKNKGFLPDFGNFCAQRSKPVTNDIKGLMATTCVKEFDKYEGVQKLMPYARGISAKTHRFGPDGEETKTDFMKMFKIIKASGWSDGYVGIEYEGGVMRALGGDTSYLPSDEGVLATKKLLEKVLKELA